jgi:hypothetical protein
MLTQTRNSLGPTSSVHRLKEGISQFHLLLYRIDLTLAPDILLGIDSGRKECECQRALHVDISSVNLNWMN